MCLGLCDPPDVLMYPATALSTPLARPAALAPRTAEKASCHGHGELERLVTGGSVAPSPVPTAALTSPALADTLYTVYLCVYFRSYMQPNGGISRRL